MSTKISQIHAALLQVLETAFPEHVRLVAERLEENDKKALAKGWELVIGGGKNTRRVVCPEYYLQRQFEVTFTRECNAKDQDVGRRDAVKLSLLEDLHLLIKQTISDLTLGEACMNFEWENDQGPSELETEDGGAVFALTTTVSIEYSQQVGG